MVLPVTGPFYQVQFTRSPAPNPSGWYPDWRLREQYVYKQAKPFDRPLAYSGAHIQVLGYEKARPGYNTNQIPIWQDVRRWPSASLNAQAYDKAYAKFRGKMGSAAELAVSFAERRQAMDMMTSRLLQLAAFTLALKRRQFNKCADILGVNRRRLKSMNLRKGAKSASSNYLEFHFGWSPLVGDIGSAMDFLQQPVPPIQVTAFHRSKESGVLEVNPGAYWYVRETDYTSSVRMSASVGVDNPNLWLANSLGFVNPATVLWELVPFSFVLDWFVNVSDFLSGFTDFYGLSLQDAYRTYTWRSTHTHTQYDGYKYWGKSALCERVLGTPPGPALKVRAPWTLSPRRGAAAAALLVQRAKTIR